MDEKKTREQLIDKQLEDVGWDEKYIKKEVNSVKSDFKNKNYILFDGKVEKGVDRFADYILLAEDYSPLAIIEAKKYSVDPEKGRVQARTYAKDIEKQTEVKIPIFLTNGLKWKFIDHRGRERKVSGPFSQSDLKRRNELFKNEQDPSTIKINPKIVDRPKSLLIVKQLSEHFAHGHRKALIQMATGTGKTRVAMALIDVLINANLIRNVLFVADRITLANQASSDGFKEFFTEPVLELHQKGFDTHSRLYASTVQTLMGGTKKRAFEKFSPGFFDLIIFDEAHRSIYDKNNLVMQYFDAIKIGLTATPREHESRNTYGMFDCKDKVPTVEYSFDEAVRDGILVNYTAEIIETKVLSLGIEGSKLTPDLKDQLRRQEVDPESAEFAGGQFDKVFMDDKTNELIIQEFMARCYKSDEGLPCKTIVFCASQRHAKRMKEIFGKLFPNLGNDVKVITSEFYRAQDEVRRFKLNSEPRIALSVGMLDTGVDIPEVCNLVFVKPVFSHVRFWQMVGRGTRNQKSCKHKEWLPDREKKDFLIMDFTVGEHSNVLFHEFNETKERVPSRDVLTRIFMNRVNLLTK
ncbi:MAG: DEAD/DEAH box helicase family protein, partial [Thermodesulfobacteriota bacterium]